MSRKVKSPSNTMITVIESKEDGLYSATNAPARIWRHFLYKRGVTGAEWYRIMGRYQERIKRNLKSSTVSGIKGNANTRLAMDRLSWESLIRGFDIMEAESIEVTITPVIRGVKYPIHLIIDNDQFDYEADKGAKDDLFDPITEGEG